MEPLFEHRLELAGHKTRVLELEGGGPPLLLFHGYADSADTWRPVLAELGRRDRRAIAVDLPGFGAATPLQPEERILDQYDDLAAELAHYAGGGAPVVAAGNSLGGVVALRLAERRDVPVGGIVPIAPAGLTMPRWFGVVERDPLLRTLLSVPMPMPEAAVRAVVGRIYAALAFARPADVPAEVIDAFTGHHRDRGVVSGYLATARRLLPELEAPFRLRDVRCPVLLVWGKRDRMVTHRGAEAIRAAIPHARVELLDGVGHCPQIEATARVVELLDAFPRRTAAAA